MTGFELVLEQSNFQSLVKNKISLLTDKYRRKEIRQSYKKC